MIYDQPTIRQTGDLSLTVEFGDELSLEASFKVLALDQSIKENASPLILETIPTHRSVGVVVDAGTMGSRRLEGLIEELIQAAADLEAINSRVVRIPMLYNDPWSSDCAARQGQDNSFEQICRENGLSSEEVIARHSSTDHWVGALGFTPGCTQAFPLDDTNTLTASKCPVPRTWTYSRIVALGGRLTAPYTVKSPGGYQMLGRTPLDWYDPTRKNPTYGDEIILSRVGDRQRFVPIDLETYDDVREQVLQGTYRYEISHGVVGLRNGQLVELVERS